MDGVYDGLLDEMPVGDTVNELLDGVGDGSLDGDVEDRRDGEFESFIDGFRDGCILDDIDVGYIVGLFDGW